MNPKVRAVILVLTCIALAFLPSSWWTIPVAGFVVLVVHLSLGAGFVALVKQFVRYRWIILLTVIPQLLFVPLEAACANSARVIAAVSIAELLSTSVPAGEILDGVARLLRPLSRWIDPERIALMVALTITTVPVLARLLSTIREAQVARGVRPRLHRLVVPLLVAALKHADELGDALVARGVGAEPPSAAGRRDLLRVR